MRGAAKPAHRDPVLLGVVFLGGAVGTAGRAWLSTAYPSPVGSFPVTTWLINMSGAAALGVLLQWLARSGPDQGRRRMVRLGGGTGVLGGLTTYSTFVVETISLGATGRWQLAMIYDVVSVATGVAAAAVGMWCVDRLYDRYGVRAS
ncbi:CrcB family protein [Austwickia sp. TVS 96-490-7B]|uniref:FluC/FEX family fluoride channel n=1 Tax=Austwickia sp. TVS 96-490-7B TaxID=2830843 RepID=UPI001C594AD7|nr:CrcB family protein [Austwickia sp. TVS 96-490-7B]